MFNLTKKIAMELSEIAEEFTKETNMDSDDFSYGADGTIFYDDGIMEVELNDIGSYVEAVNVLTEFIESNAIEVSDDDEEDCDDTDSEPDYGDEMCKPCAIQLSIDDVIYNTLQSPEPITNQAADVMLKLVELKRVLLEVNS